MAFILFVGIPITPMLSPIPGTESIVNRSARFFGRDFAVELAELMHRLLSAELRSMSSSHRVDLNKLLSISNRGSDLIKQYLVATSMRLVSRIINAKLDPSTLRDFCREAAYTIAKRIGKGIHKALGYALIALYDYDLEVLKLIESVPIDRLYARYRRTKVREVIGQSIDVASRIATTVVVLLRILNAKESDIDAVTSRILEDVYDLEAYIDTIAILLDPENEEIARALVSR